MLLSEFHVDGFRVDLTQSFHRDNVIEGNGAICVRHAVCADGNGAARPVFMVEHLVWFSPLLPAALVAATATGSVDLDEPL